MGRHSLQTLEYDGSSSDAPIWGWYH